MNVRPSRRAVLSAGALGLAAACTSTRQPARPAPVDPDLALTVAAVSRERDLLAVYDAALAVAPDLAVRLGPVRADHAAHLAALGAPPENPTPAPTASPPSETPTIAPTASAPPPAAARSGRVPPGLAAAERAAASAHAAAALTASPHLAQVLASLAASEASHPVALG